MPPTLDEGWTATCTTITSPLLTEDLATAGWVSRFHVEGGSLITLMSRRDVSHVSTMNSSFWSMADTGLINQDGFMIDKCDAIQIWFLIHWLLGDDFTSQTFIISRTDVDRH